MLGFGVLLLTLVPGYMASHVRVANAPFDAHIKEAANRYAISEDVIAAVIEAESRFNARAVSRRGAQGLMQLMPATAATLGVRDPFDPRDNIDGGVRHLRSLMDRFNHDLPLALAAYNAGEQAVLQNRGVPPFRETRDYVSRIMRRMNRDRVKS